MSSEIEAHYDEWMSTQEDAEVRAHPVTQTEICFFVNLINYYLCVR